MTDVWEERPATVLAAGKFLGDGKRLDPNVPSSREFAFFVPGHRYQLLRLRAQLFAIPPRSAFHSARCPNTRISRVTTSCTDSGRLSTKAGCTT